MTRNRASGTIPSPSAVTYYVQRATAGLIITEGSQISPQGVGYIDTPGIHSDEQVEGWKRITDAVHRVGGRIFLQLWHVGRVSHPSLQPGGALPVAPSAIAPEGTIFTRKGPQPFVTPRALETEEIASIVSDFARAAGRAREAGFDGVELHGANGYLIDQFLRDGSNRRTDRYGGSLENRLRFLTEVTAAVAEVWGADGVGVRLSPHNSYNGMSDSDPAKTFLGAASALAPLGLAYLHVVEPVETPAADRLAARMRRAFRGPLIINGGYDRTSGDAALAAGEADLVSFGVPFIANPDLPQRFAIGAPLAPADRATFYGGDERGYVDYPSWDPVEAVRAA